MDHPVKIINLGSAGKIYSGVDGAPIAGNIPGAEYHAVEGAGHFSFLGECTKIGPEILKAERDDPICDEPSDRKRADIHAEIAAHTAAFLKRHLASTN